MSGNSQAISQNLHLQIQHEARRLGFELVGIAAARTPNTWPQYLDWLAKGFSGEMHYLHRHAQARSHPRHVFTDVRSLIIVGLNYKPAVLNSSRSLPPNTGRVSCYAWGRDYHRVLRRKLRHLLRWLQTQVPDCRGRIVVDSAPLLERDFAQQAGLGWFGKNTMLINKRLGSFIFLGALLVNIELQPDPPFDTSHCGSCTACLEACPTQAFIHPGMLDARRCISYLTIELRGPIPEELRPAIGHWVFGCDVCQDVCPWNRKAPNANPLNWHSLPDLEALNLVELFSLSEAEFRTKFLGTALMRAGREGLLRNAAIVLGNRRHPESVPALGLALNDESPVVRGAAAWALGQIASPDALQALSKRLALESNESVCNEIVRALRSADTAVPRGVQ